MTLRTTPTPTPIQWPPPPPPPLAATGTKTSTCSHAQGSQTLPGARRWNGGARHLPPRPHRRPHPRRRRCWRWSCDGDGRPWDRASALRARGRPNKPRSSRACGGINQSEIRRRCRRRDVAGGAVVAVHAERALLSPTPRVAERDAEIRDRGRDRNHLPLHA